MDGEEAPGGEWSFLLFGKTMEPGSCSGHSPRLVLAAPEILGNLCFLPTPVLKTIPKVSATPTLSHLPTATAASSGERERRLGGWNFALGP